MRAPAGAAWRSGVLLVANVGFLSLLFDTVQDATSLALFLAFGYACIIACRNLKNSYVTPVSIGLLTCLFIYLKQYTFIDFIPKLAIDFQAIGVSYIFFRIVHLIIDERNAQIEERVGVLDYFNFTANFLTFVSGPVTRIQDSYADLREPAEATDGFIAGAIYRIVLGFFKLLVIASLVGILFDRFGPQILGASETTAPALLVYCAAAALYTAYLYYNFSGSMDVVIGFGRLAGLRLPENFNRPFLSRNMIEFWGRWHMTLSNWFKTYLFTPTLMFLLKTFRSPKLATSMGVVAYFVVFAIMGVWHGSTYIFLIYGFFLGAGVAGNKLYQNLMVKRLGRKRYKALSQKPLYIYASRGLTIGYFAVSLSSFWMTTTDLVAVGARITSFGYVAAVLLLSLAWGVSAAVLDFVTPRFISVYERVKQTAIGLPAPGMRFGYPAFAALIILTAIVQITINKPAEFVYAQF